MNGLGFMIWQLANMPAPAVLAQMLADGGVRWVSIKVLDGVQLYNAKGGNQKLLKEYWAAIKAKGIEVGGWHYVYGEQPGPEGDAAAGFIEEFDPAHLLIDAEGEYKRYGATKAAKAYCAKLKVNRLIVHLCAYRFPSLHGGAVKPFPFSAFLNAESVDGTAPQVYWVDGHDPVGQVQRSLAEYRKLTSKPFIPIGSSYGQWIQPKDAPKYWWEPTVADLRAFVDYCKLNFQAYGFFSLDFILKNKRMDWWQAITNQTPTPPPPPDLDDHEKITRLWQFAQEQGWDV